MPRIRCGLDDLDIDVIIYHLAGPVQSPPDSNRPVDPPPHLPQCENQDVMRLLQAENESGNADFIRKNSSSKVLSMHSQSQDLHSLHPMGADAAHHQHSTMALYVIYSASGVRERQTMLSKFRASLPVTKLRSKCVAMKSNSTIETMGAHLEREQSPSESGKSAMPGALTKTAEMTARPAVLRPKDLISSQSGRTEEDLVAAVALLSLSEWAPEKAKDSETAVCLPPLLGFRANDLLQVAPLVGTETVSCLPKGKPDMAVEQIFLRLHHQHRHGQGTDDP